MAAQAARAFDQADIKKEGQAPETDGARAAAGLHADVLTLQAAAGNAAVSALRRGQAEPDAAALAQAGAGQPLGAATRREMEQRFGHEFGDVRVHTDAQAAQAAAAVSARAYTVGNDVVFGEGRFAPETSAGRQLLAHELAHVVQQSRGGAPPSLDADSSLEQAAATAADQAAQGSGPVAVAGASGVGMARAADEETPFYQRLNRVYQRALDVAPPAIRERIEQVNAAAQQMVDAHGINEQQIDKVVQAAEPVLQQAETALGIQSPKAAQPSPLPTVWLGQRPLDVRLQQKKQAQQQKDQAAAEDPAQLPPPQPRPGMTTESNINLWKTDPPPTDFEKKLQARQPFPHQVTVPARTLGPVNWVGRRPSEATIENLPLYEDDNLMRNAYVSKDNILRTKEVTVNLGKLNPDDVSPVRDSKTGELTGYRLRTGMTVSELDRDGNIVTNRGLEAPLETPTIDPIDVAFFAADVGPLVAKGLMAGGKLVIRSAAKGLTREATEIGSESIAKSATRMQSKVGQEAIDTALSSAKPSSGVSAENLPLVRNAGGNAANDVLPNNVIPLKRPQAAVNVGEGNVPLAKAEGFGQGGAVSGDNPAGLRLQASRGSSGDFNPPRRGSTGVSADVSSLPGRGQSTGSAGRSAGGPSPTAIDPKSQAAALKFAAKRAGGKVTPIHQSAEDYAESLVRTGGIPQIGKLDRVIPGQLPAGSGMPPRAGKDLWGFRNGNPVSVEIKNYGRDLTSVKGRPSLEGTKQISPTGDKMDWLTWVKANPQQAQSLVDAGVLDAKWLDIGEGGYVRRNAANHFLRAGNRYAIVISPGGQAGIAPSVLQDIKLPADAVIRLAVPE